MVSGFERAVERHQRRVYTFARYHLGNPEDADDVAQEVLLKMWREWRKIEPERLSPWLLRVTRNACYDRLRRRRSAAKVFVPEPEDGGADVTRSADPGPAAQAEASDFQRHLLEALEEMGDPLKSIVILREIQGFKYREISDALDMPLNTVRVYLHRGRRRLRERLREVYGHVATA